MTEIKMARRLWRMVKGVQNRVPNWRKFTLQTCPLLQQAGGRRMGGEDSVLAGAGVYSGLARSFPLLVAAEGFLTGRFHMFSPGVSVAVVVWHFWRGKIGRGPGQE
jgi:hypothetical protein